jgi:WD40 repeat protein
MHTFAGSPEDNTSHVWDAATGKRLLTLRGAADEQIAAQEVAFSPDGKQIFAACSDRTIRIWDSTTGKALAVYRGHEGSVWTLAFSRDGALLATGSEDRTVRIWDAQACRNTAPQRGLWQANQVVFSPDGKSLVTWESFGQTAHLWDLATRQERATFRVRSNAWTNVPPVFSPDGRLLAFVFYHGKINRIDTNRAILFDAHSGQELRHFDIQGPHQPSGLAFRFDGARLVVTASGIGQVWDPETGKRIVTLANDQDRPINDAIFSPDGRRILTRPSGRGISMATTNKPNASVWDAETGKLLLDLKHNDRVNAAACSVIAFSADGRRILTASASARFGASLWDSATGVEVLGLRGHQAAINYAAFSPDQSRIATASDDRTVRIWDAQTGKELLLLRGHTKGVRSVQFSPDGHLLLTQSDDHTARLWDVATGKEYATVKASGLKDQFKFSPDGRWVLAPDYRGGESVVQLWPVDALEAARQRLPRALTAEERTQYELEEGPAAAPSPQGKQPDSLH